MSAKFLFIDSAEHNEATRRRARSHVMLGKNTGRKIKRRSRLAIPIATTPCTDQHHCSFEARDQCGGSRAEIGRNLGHALQSLALPVEVTADAAYAINHYFNSTAARMYPVHLGITIEGSKLMWLQVLFVDKTSYYCNLAMMQACNEVYDSNNGCSPKALYYIDRSYPYVQKVLQGREALSDTSIGIVLSLVCQEMIRNSVEELRIHFEGLVRMVDMRGGINGLERNQALMLKICKIDIVCALQSGNKPRFFHDRFPDLESPIRSKSLSQCLQGALDTLDYDQTLRDVWVDSLAFSSTFRDPSQSTLSLLAFEEVVISLCSRLLAVRTLAEAAKSHDENSLIHLGLLLFSMTTFLQYHGRQIVEFPILDRCIRNVLKKTARNEDPGLMLWVSVMGGLWMRGGPQRTCLAAKLNEAAACLGIASWEDAHRYLAIFPWISAIHDRAAETFWENTFRFGVTE